MNLEIKSTAYSIFIEIFEILRYKDLNESKISPFEVGLDVWTDLN